MAGNNERLTFDRHESQSWQKDGSEHYRKQNKIKINKQTIIIQEEGKQYVYGEAILKTMRTASGGTTSNFLKNEYVIAKQFVDRFP
jgi:hypothetical protein